MPAKLSVPVPGAERPIELMLVKPGEFFFGATSDQVKFEEAALNEGPGKEISLTQPFYIGRTEVTTGQILAFAKAVPELQLRKSQWERLSLTWIDGGYALAPGVAADLPATGISWDMAAEFCEWMQRETGLQFALPPEVQWEYAARGPQSRIYPWGDQWDASKCLAGKSASRALVGSYPQGASWCGAEDMAGNVLEWCGDGFRANRHEQIGPRDPARIRPLAGDNYVLKGGSYGWSDPSEFLCRASWRFGARGYDDRVGFRVMVYPSRKVLEYKE
jgi:formylglycine-generating enzyme required for sulfatase activity